MNSSILIGILIFFVAISMTMVGKGGGNFYVLIMAMAGTPMHEAAATGQFILFFASLSAIFIFSKGKSISWKLAIIIGGLTAISAFGGGILSHVFTGPSLKLIFSAMLFISGGLMLYPFATKSAQIANKKYIINFRSGKEIYSINLLIVIPVTVITGFFSGMVGVSGGSFLVPLMVLAAGVPMHTAVGTASILIATTAFMGFTGHTIHGDLNLSTSVPLAAVTLAGGFIGGKFALKSKPKNLKKLFAYTNWIAALFMVINVFSA